MNDYSSLVNDVNQWLARSDMVSEAPTFIRLAEDRIARTLRVKDMEAAYAENTAIDGTVPVPEGYIEIKDFAVSIPRETPPFLDEDTLVIDTGAGPLVGASGRIQSLERTSPEFIYNRNNERQGMPTHLARAGANFLLWPFPDRTYEVTGFYYRRFPALSVQSPTNWLTANAYDCILYGTLAEASAYIKSMEQHQFWMQRFENVINEMQASNDKEEHSGSRLTQRIPGP